ncbi:hypothetical protein BC830DRAFT_1140974 [Chytriomyces sp. MP71]|nr:hypothetical protein BC830DRAFT_1148520 [Chytriomyces sp. MP71]KAI8611478.1 hypothetical protein BC830DRAFT_1140974 [Chytriomyces sp. MP71]
MISKALFFLAAPFILINAFANPATPRDNNPTYSPEYSSQCTFGAYKCDGNRLYQCAYVDTSKLDYRLLWDCGSSDRCTIEDSGYVGCIPKGYDYKTHDWQSDAGSRYGVADAPVAYNTPSSSKINNPETKQYPQSCSTFGAWKCEGRTLFQCGYVAGPRLAFRWTAECPVGQFCNANGPNGFVGCQLTNPAYMA